MQMEEDTRKELVCTSRHFCYFLKNVSKAYFYSTHSQERNQEFSYVSQKFRIVGMLYKVVSRPPSLEPVIAVIWEQPHNISSWIKSSFMASFEEMWSLCFVLQITTDRVQKI